MRRHVLTITMDRVVVKRAWISHGIHAVGIQVDTGPVTRIPVLAVEAVEMNRAIAEGWQRLAHPERYQQRLDRDRRIRQRADARRVPWSEERCARQSLRMREYWKQRRAG